MNGGDAFSAGCRMAAPGAALIPHFIICKRSNDLKNENISDIIYRLKASICHMGYVIYYIPEKKCL
jgi:hypothetical protein